MLNKNQVQQSFRSFLSNPGFPCVAARDALAKSNLKIMLAGHLACPADDHNILKFIAAFVRDYRKEPNGFHSAAIIFPGGNELSELEFDQLLWMRLRALRAIDALRYRHDPRVSEDPSAAGFSFSLVEEAFFIVGMHPNSSRPARRAPYPVLIFNPHQQFETLKKKDRFEKLKDIVRKRDLVFSGSVNPMLSDFGSQSEIFQYSGRQYTDKGECPYKP